MRSSSIRTICAKPPRRPRIPSARIAILGAIFVYCSVARATGPGQIQTGTIKGRVTDPTSAALVGARIKLDNSITGFKNETVIDSEGTILIANIGFDAYRLRATAAGFQSIVQTVSVRSNIPVAIDIRMSPAGVSETVNVESPEQL